MKTKNFEGGEYIYYVLLPTRDRETPIGVMVDTKAPVDNIGKRLGDKYEPRGLPHHLYILVDNSVELKVNSYGVLVAEDLLYGGEIPISQAVTSSTNPKIGVPVMPDRVVRSYVYRNDTIDKWEKVYGKMF